MIREIALGVGVALALRYGFDAPWWGALVGSWVFVLGTRA